MALSFGLNTANAMLNAITAKIDAGSAAGRLRIYAGTLPASADTALTSQVLLAELICTDPSAATASNKTLTLSAIAQDTSADASGTATFFRVVDSSFATVLQGTVTAVSGGGDMEMNTTAITAGGPVQISSAVFTLA